MAKRWKVAGVNFDHFHMGDLLRMAVSHPAIDLVGICDETPQRMAEAIRSFQLPKNCVFTDVDECLDSTRPDIVILCPSTAEHAEWTERVAPFACHVLIEKPFAASVADADRMTAALARTGKQLAINWPLRWFRSHATAYRLIQEGHIGKVREVHYYDGNRGPLWHGAQKIEREPTAAEKESSWFYKKSAGGGSLLDYLGYGTTLGTWFQQNRAPQDVTCTVHRPKGLEVDEHSITVARYEAGLSKFETRWGTFTDPWTHQPQPKCGFVITGEEGTLSSYDYDSVVRIQTSECPEGRDEVADELKHPNSNPVEYFIQCLEDERPVEGPLSPTVSRIGQLIVDAAIESAARGQTIKMGA